MKQIAIYGKGGIGKSTITANLSAALAETGLHVLQIGCDPKHDSTKLLLHGAIQATVLELLKTQSPAALRRPDVILRGYLGVDCIEAGGPEPGVGCAGRGILSMANALEAIGLDRSAYDIIVYDVLGDVVCGGFAVPMRAGYADEIYIVSSGEIMALYAANNICRGVVRLGGKLGGVIGNARNVPCENELLARFAQAVGSELIDCFPRNDCFRQAELQRCTVIEYSPECELASRFRRLAERIASGANPVLPRPLSEECFEQLIFEVAGGKQPAERASHRVAAESNERDPSLDGFQPYLEKQEACRSAPPPQPYQAKALRERAPLHSCALAGAFSITNHVLDAITLMHSPAGCAYTSLAGTFIAGEGASLRGLTPTPSHVVPRLVCTNLKEIDSIHGGEQKLEAEIRAAVAKYAPAAVLLITSCPSAIVGDDAFRVARRLSDLAVPVIATETDGIMKGDYAQGMINAYENLTDAFVVAERGLTPDTTLINLVGEEPIGNSADEDFARLCPLFEALGLRVNTRFVRRTTVASLRNFHRAAFSLRLSNSEPARMAQQILREKAGARFVPAPPPVGFAATSLFLQAVAEACQRPVPVELVRQARAEGGAVAARLRPALTGKRVLLGVYTQDVSWVGELAASLGFSVVGLAVLDSCMNTSLGDIDAPVLQIKDADQLLRVVGELAPDLFLANYLPRGLPEGLQADVMPLCPPLGFTGTMRVAEIWARTLRRGAEGWRRDHVFAGLQQ